MRPSFRLVMCVGLLLAPVASAQLEALENPGTVAAVQDRLFRMNHELRLGVGVLPLDAFYKGVSASVGYTAHFSDTFAWTVGRGLYSYNLNTGLRGQLENQFGVAPTEFEEVEWMVGSDLVWSPWYGKTSFLNQSVTHFDVSLVAGGSVLRMVDNSFRPALNLGIGARLYASRSVSWRLDFTDNVVFVLPALRVVHVPTIQLSLALNFGATE